MLFEQRGVDRTHGAIPFALAATSGNTDENWPEGYPPIGAIHLSHLQGLRIFFIVQYSSTRSFLVTDNDFCRNGSDFLRNFVTVHPISYRTDSVCARGMLVRFG